MSVSRHQPVRPSWRCLACGDDWPCRRRRTELTLECGRDKVRLALYMAGFFSDALDDSPQASPQDLYRRFLGWFCPGPR